ncbi:NrsF family protein [Asticcacaulis sp. AND118]|uniref:NrsF family protein n=1 Tax=Asticcacaulis sp. AND118 TaxID=2840468 RepID=UPI001CFFC469|nr:NrsF family protein [Asticcacaulis sp. AND118]UDF05160.1 DUF1109 domain-containing protein [Asticcacaulis sp. AND118]
MSKPETDRLIEDLSRATAPVSVLSPRGLILWAALFLTVASVLIVAAYGARPEMRVLVGEWRVHENLSAYAKTGFFMAVAALALGLVKGMARPEGRLDKPQTALLALGVGGLAALTGAELVVHGWQAAMADLKGGASVCFLTVLSGGLGGLGAGWFLWLRRAAPGNPSLFGALSAFAASALMTVAYSLHCGHDAPIYLLLIYLAPNLVAAVLGGFAGRWLFRW